MATFIECVKFRGGVAILRAEDIQAVEPQFNEADEFTCSKVYMAYGGIFTVNEVWEQIEAAAQAEGFSVCTPTLKSVFG